MGGGGGSGGGVVVGGPSQYGANLAGLYQSQAVDAAVSAAKQQTNEALKVLQQQYMSASTSLKPYTQTGIQALNEMNALMGLNAYNPGSAPKAPKAYSVTDNQIKDYIRNNTSFTKAGKDGNIYANYTGVGTRWDGSSHQYLGGPATGQMLYGAVGLARDNDVAGGVGPRPGLDAAINNLFATAPDIISAIRKNLTDTYNQENADLIELNQQQYQQDLENWQYAKDLYDKYTAEGPYTAEKIQEKLEATPGYQFQMSQGTDAIQRAASSKGLLNSGRLLQSLVDYGQGLASQTYGDTLSRLAGVAQMGQQSAAQQANNSMNYGQSNAATRVNLGDTIANSYLAKGNALSQAALAANQQYQVIGGGDGGGGGLGGLGSLLGGIASMKSAGIFSSKALKNKTADVSTTEILNKVKELQIDKWQYKGINAEHIGPYAEDFKDAFNVGDGQTINIIDYLGVLLGAVKELSIKVDELTKEVK